MKWPQWQRGDVMSVLVLLLMGSILFFAAATTRGTRVSFDFGFGKGWNCSPSGYGEPICLRKAPNVLPR
jgi:hypothetical protein